MIAKIKRGDGFKGILAYVLDKEGAECIGGTVIGESPEIAKMYRIAIPAHRASVVKPVWHSSLSLPAGEHLDSKQWQQVADKYLIGMGMSLDRCYTVVRHSDTDYDHIHVVASRVALDGSLWSGRNDRYKAAEVTTALEREYGLTVVEREKYGTKRESGRMAKNPRTAAGAHCSSESSTQSNSTTTSRGSEDDRRTDRSTLRVSRADRRNERDTAKVRTSGDKSTESSTSVGSGKAKKQVADGINSDTGGSAGFGIAESCRRRRRRHRWTDNKQQIGIAAATALAGERRRIEQQKKLEEAQRAAEHQQKRRREEIREKWRRRREKRRERDKDLEMEL